MYKNLFWLSSFILIILTVSGCTNTNKSITESANLAPETNKSDRAGFNSNDNFDQLAIEDIATGQVILVQGNENTDKSILAERIVINPPENLLFGQQKNTEQINLENKQQTPLEETPSLRTGNRPDPTQLQNLSEEDRQAMKTKMQGRFNNGTGTPRLGGTTTISLKGEVLSVEENGLKIKLEDGGSRIVYFSSSVFIGQQKKSPNEIE